MTIPPVQWTTPAPTWAQLLNGQSNGRNTAFQRPLILRFASDEFMEEFLQLVANEPERLEEWQAQPESWRAPAAEPVPVASLPPLAQRVHRLRLQLNQLSDGQSSNGHTLKRDFIDPPQDLKLFQPAHQRYYLVCASLVCQLAGLPDKLFDNNAGEGASFVVRRLLPRIGADGRPLTSAKPVEANLGQFDEYAFVPGAAVARWQRIGRSGAGQELLARNDLAPGEEQLPLFPTGYVEASGQARRLLAGVIPVGKRERYLGALLASSGDAGGGGGPTGGGDALHGHLVDFQRQVVFPWRALNDLYDATLRRMKSSPIAYHLAYSIPGDEQAAADTGWSNTWEQAYSQIQTGSWYTLLDFAGYLQRYLPDVLSQSAGQLGGTPAAQALRLTLENNSYTDTDGNTTTLAAALVSIQAFSQRLETATVSYDDSAPLGFPWPDFRFRLTALASLVNVPEDEALSPLEDQLAAAVSEAAAQEDLTVAPPLPLAASQSLVESQSAHDLTQPAWFIIRCVFERPLCLEAAPIVLSAPTTPFQMANFFDPEAPARPIRIALPVDTSPAGLRKFDKNTAFVISDVLACQMERAGGLTLGDLVLSVLPWPFHKDLPGPGEGACKEGGFGLGMICSLSIPIITICALILLMIIVAVLDQIFKWIPYLIACFPLPSLNTRSGGGS